MLAGGSSLVAHQNLGLGFCSSRIVQLSSFMVKPPSMAIADYHPHRLQQRMVSSSGIQPKSSGDIPVFRDNFSQQEADNEQPAEGLSSMAGGIVALGKFDALHIGHRELAIQASKIGTPYLLSFVGMAEVFGWEPRAPIVANCDRKRVLSSWASYCGNAVPREFQVEFSSVRHLTPQQFVEKLSKEFGICGVVAGENYRFGYKAAGDAAELQRLCSEYGLGSFIINSVMDKKQGSGHINSSNLKERGQVSSTRVRHALAIGDMQYVSELLGRSHRLFLVIKDWKELTSASRNHSISAPKSSLLNLPPKEGFYENCSVFFGREENPVTCRVLIDSTHIHLDMDQKDLFHYDNSQESWLLDWHYKIVAMREGAEQAVESKVSRMVRIFWIPIPVGKRLHLAFVFDDRFPHTRDGKQLGGWVLNPSFANLTCLAWLGKEEGRNQYCIWFGCMRIWNQTPKASIQKPN